MTEARITRRQALGVIGATVLTADALIRPRNVLAQSPLPSASPSEQPSLQPEIPVYLTPEMQVRTSAEFSDMYREFTDLFVIKAGKGRLRTIYDMDPQHTRTAMEYQGMAELFALYAGDTQTAEQLFKYDDKYKQKSGLTPWLIGDNGKVADQTVVSAPMMHMAAARLLSPDSERQNEGRDMLQSLIDNEVIRPDIHVPQAFHWIPGSYDYTNPAYWSPLFLEWFSEQDPSWSEVSQGTRKFMAKVDARIDNGEYAYFPQFTNMEGEVQPDPGGNPPFIGYDAPWLAIQQGLGAIHCEDPVARQDAARQLSYADKFFYSKIALKDDSGNVTGYDIDGLKDGYNLDGSLTDGQHWPKTAWASAAVVASIVSPNEAYRDYMFDQLINLPHPTGNAFNDFIRNFALLAFSGKMEGLKPQPSNE